MRVALGIEYLGTRYCGWQSQSNACAIQDVIEAAMSKIAEHRVQIYCAGRTDTGVHACEQVVHFDSVAERPLNAWVRGTNANLPSDIAVQWASQVNEEFHARFSARSRYYRYVLLNRSQRSAVGAGRVGWYHRPLDVDSMRQAAQILVGTKDFSTFRSSECQAASPIKTMHSFIVNRHGDYVIFDLHADGFLHHMVRNIVGSLVFVGSGRGTVEWTKLLLEQRDRRLAAPTFMPDGLYLMGVEYDSGWGLPQRSLLVQQEMTTEMLL